MQSANTDSPKKEEQQKIALIVDANVLIKQIPLRQVVNR
jgi:hypothetical protein